ncbi:MAG: hypothetical protein L3J14_03680 [Flavobacteriaceae bacterium]|nr:hypothetical protein [Flavobacteriaceae bacterium]
MKKRFLILSFILFQCTQVFAQFNGGNADGHDVEARLNTTLENISLVILYQGGNGDGHDIEALLNTTLENISLTVLYNGGNGDGHDIEALLNTTLENISLAILYDGGTGDGHDVKGLLNTTLENISLAVLYEGGNGDGHDIEALLNTTLENISLTVLYDGGIGDGFSKSQENVFLDPSLINIKINPIAFLQGAYINPILGEETLMRDNLRTASLIPITSPYVDLLTSNASVFTQTGDDAIVDWVWVELRDENDNTNILASQSALLQRDGDIVGVDGISPLIFNIQLGNYYVAISHRNHLGILSTNTIALSSTSTIVNLSNNSTSVNGGTNGVVNLGNGIFALYAGDYDGNGQVQNTDLTAVRPLLGQPSDYENADLDMNTQVQNTDLNNLLNPNKGRGQQYSKNKDLKLYAKRNKNNIDEK